MESVVAKVQRFMSHVTGCIVRESDCQAMLQSPDVQEVLRNPEVVEFLDNPPLYKDLAPANLEGVSLKSRFLAAVDTLQTRRDRERKQSGPAKLPPGGGKNFPHAGGGRKQQAEDELKKAKEERDRLASLPNKTPKDKDDLEKAKRKVERLRRRAKFGGDTDSRKPKGRQGGYEIVEGDVDDQQTE